MIRHTRAFIAAALMVMFISGTKAEDSTNAPASRLALSFHALKQDLLAKGCYEIEDTTRSNLNWQSLVHVRSDTDVSRLRTQVIAQIWPGGYPTGYGSLHPAAPTTSTTDPDASGMYRFLAGRPGLEADFEQRWVIDLGFGLRSVVYFWKPSMPNGRLFVLHDGHSNNSYRPDGTVQGPAIAKEPNVTTVSQLLSLSYSVIWLQMPLFGDNLDASSPELPFDANCRGNCDRHTMLFRAANDSYSAFRFFLEPVTVALNYALSQADYRDVTMMGASGGGWTTLLMAALDPRILTSVSVAGSLPASLREGPCGAPSAGDGEQRDQPGVLYRNVNYLDLYIMAANGDDVHGRQRLHIQINNQYDTCCFFGVTQQPFARWLEAYVGERHLGDYRHILNSNFVGHGYEVSPGKPATNKTLSDVVLPALPSVK